MAHHHHHDTKITQLNRVYIISLVLNGAFIIVETIAGIMANSMGLLSDAGHNLGDVFSLMLAMAAIRLAHSHSTKQYTYGFRKSSVLISLLNAIILAVAVGVIAVESISKIFNPTTVEGNVVIWTATVGIVINGATAWVLARSHHHDIITRGAYLHMLADALVSVGVVVSGMIINQTGWNLIDAITGLAVATLILISTWRLLAESLRMSIDAVPEGINPDAILRMIEETDGVKEAHHLHIWAISTTETALTVHIVVDDITQSESIIQNVKERLTTEKICHSTIEAETENSLCNHNNCC